MRSTWGIVAITLCLVAGAAFAQNALPGRQPGTERWLVCLRDRAFDLNQELASARAAATPTERRLRMANLQQLVATDQAAIVQAVRSAGGTLERGFWAANALVVEIPPLAIPVLRGLRRVRSLVPVTGVGPGDACAAFTPELPLPIGTSANALNHNVVGARSILTNPNGNGARIAIFDTGIDADADGVLGTDPTHPSFRQPGSLGNPASSRVVHLRAQPGTTIDINNITAGNVVFSQLPPFAFRPCNHSWQAGHGTAMAGIFGGNDVPAVGLTRGHAPEAEIVDVAFSVPVTVLPQPLARDPWQADDAQYLAAIETLEAYIVETAEPVHVLNMSWSGFPDPNHPVSTALDALARRQDILLVTIAGNDPDATLGSHGFYHGLAVGGVHARTDQAPANLSFRPMPQTSRGPLVSDPRRFYPDVCATGAGAGFVVSSTTRSFRYPAAPQGPTNPNNSSSFYLQGVRDTMLQMPNADLLDTSAFNSCGYWPGAIRYNFGTSEAAAQVSGAAALYRGERAATAEETRAAILLNVLGIYTTTDGQAPLGPGQHTYSSRNTFGVGYVRDDLLAQFAVRDPNIAPLYQSVVVSANVGGSGQGGAGLGSSTVNYTVVQGERYGIVACWRRLENLDALNGEWDLPNVDLEVWDQSVSTLIARSSTPANAYERLAFIAPTTTQVVIRVVLTGSADPSQSVPVTVVARSFSADLDPATDPQLGGDPDDDVHALSGEVESLSAGATCVGQSRDLSVVRVVPPVNAQAYGSGAFGMTPLGQPPAQFYTVHHRYAGFDLGNPRFDSNLVLHLQYCDSAMGPGDITIGGVAFRTWAPFEISGALQIARIWAEVRQSTGVPNSLSLRSSWSVSNAVAVASNLVLPAAPTARSAETGFDRFSVVIPFATPITYTRAQGARDLHLWLVLAGPGSSVPVYEVDITSDGGAYGWHFSDPRFPAPDVESFASAPVIGLLPDVALATRELRLESFGEPWIGHALDLHISRAPASTALVLAIGGWSPGTGGTCALHLASPQTLALLVTDAAGFARSTMTIGGSASLVHSEFGLQAVFSSNLGSNGLRVRVGGGL